MKILVVEIEKVITKAGKDLLESVELFDEYRGENVPEGQRSLAFRLILHSALQLELHRNYVKRKVKN